VSSQAILSFDEACSTQHNGTLFYLVQSQNVGPETSQGRRRAWT